MTSSRATLEMLPYEDRSANAAVYLLQYMRCRLGADWESMALK